jgi:CheY-like chemotaxis protein
MAGKKILVADDSLTIQKVIRLALSNEGYEIQAVSDGNDAIQQISLFRPDLVLIDVSLPGQSAFEVKRDLNTMSDLENVRFVLMSSAFEKVDEPQAAEVKFHGRLTKPFDPAHLRQVITEVLGQAPAKRATAAAMEPTAPVDLSSPPPLPSTMPEIPVSEDDSPEPEFVSPAVPVMPEPPSESVQDIGELWTPPAPDSRPDSDIKHLTESTIRMSGLMERQGENPLPLPDDFNWSVSEPSLKPHPAMMDATGVTFRLNPGDLSSAPPPFQPEMEVSAPPELPPLGSELDLDPPASEESSLSLNMPPPSASAASPTDFYRGGGAPVTPPGMPGSWSIHDQPRTWFAVREMSDAG